jgi:hypothetical protein
VSSSSSLTYNFFLILLDRVSVGSLYNDSLLAGWFGVRTPVRARSSAPAVGPTQPAIQWVPNLFPGGQSSRGEALTAHPI